MQNIVEGKLITKERRQEMFGQVAGGSGSMKPEEYQRSTIVELTGVPCAKTNMRINLRTSEMLHLTTPNIYPNGFDYSENFDGVQHVNDNTIYINLKCVVGSGGTQTRSLREVYWFINSQLDVLTYTDDVYFANILDGDEAHSVMDKYEYLITQPMYKSVKNRLYVGDLKGYIDWFKRFETKV